MTNKVYFTVHNRGYSDTVLSKINETEFSKIVKMREESTVSFFIEKPILSYAEKKRFKRTEHGFILDTDGDVLLDVPVIYSEPVITSDVLRKMLQDRGLYLEDATFEIPNLVETEKNCKIIVSGYKEIDCYEVDNDPKTILQFIFCVDLIPSNDVFIIDGIETRKLYDY